MSKVNSRRLVAGSPALLPGRTLRAIDLFCGVGGSSIGARQAGVEVIAGFDMDTIAIDTYKANFPAAWACQGHLEQLDPVEIAEQLGRVDILLASPECTSHSPARGSRKPSEDSRNTAFQVTRFAQALKPRWIVIENVISMKRWHRYEKFLLDLEELGYHWREEKLDAADFGVPQARRRLFIICELGRVPSPIKLPVQLVAKQICSFLEMNGKFPFTPLFRQGRAKGTLQRAKRAMADLGKKTPFLIVYYGTDGGGGWQRIDAPLRTITTLDRFALVKPGKDGYVMRMLQVPELKSAMGFPASFKLESGTRRDRIKLLGNAVCPPVMKAVVRSICRSEYSTSRGTSRENRR